MAGHPAQHAGWQPAAHPGNTERGKRERNGDSQHGQPSALDNHLQHQAPSAGAQREPHRELVVALGAAGEEQVGDVGAGDQQEQQRRGLPYRQERSGALVRQAAGHRHDRNLPVRMGVRVSLPLPLDDGAHLVSRSRQRPAVTEPAEHEQEPAVPLHALGVGQGQRGVDFSTKGNGRSRTQHADDLVRLAVEANQASDDRRVAPEASDPQPMGEDHALILARSGLGIEERAAVERLRADQAKELGTDPEAGKLLGLA